MTPFGRACTRTERRWTLPTRPRGGKRGGRNWLTTGRTPRRKAGPGEASAAPRRRLLGCAGSRARVGDQEDPPGGGPLERLVQHARRACRGAADHEQRLVAL